MASSLPSQIGRYQVRRELGRGMMGVVYEAHDPLLGRTVALKTFNLAFALEAKERGAFEKRFLEEARAAAGLAHPGIVVVFDVGREDGSGKLYMALEYLRGRTLDAMLSGGALEWREALRIGARLAEALQHAHSQGIIHRDIKPANIMLLDSGEPKIMDFGIAKLPASQLTTKGQILGSPSYMSPERAMEQPLDGRSDLFSLGAVLYELLTGQRAFPGPNIPTILTRVAYEHPAAPTQRSKELPPAVDYVLARMLAKSRSDRYPDGKTLAGDLQDLLEARPPRHQKAWTPPPANQETLAKAKSPAPAAPAPPASGDDTAQGGAGRPASSLPAGKRVSLAILAGAREGEIFVLERPQALIGRAGGRANADIEIADPEASRAHAVVECHGSLIVVRDLGSTNGTFVGEERISDESPLENQAEFRVGRTRFMLIVSDRE